MKVIAKINWKTIDGVQGFTLVEVLVSFFILGIMFAGIAGLIQINAKYYNDSQKIGNTTRSMAYTLNMLTKDIREAKRSQITVTESGRMLKLDGTNDKYHYNKGLGLLEKKNGAGSYDTLLTNLDGFSFDDSNVATNGTIIINIQGKDEKGNTVSLQSEVKLRN